MTKKKPIQDPEWNAQARAGEIVSRLSLLGEDLKTLVNELDAKATMVQRSESRLLKRGTLEIRSGYESFVASFDPEGGSIEVNGRTVPKRPMQLKGVGRDVDQALDALSREIAMSVVQ